EPCAQMKRLTIAYCLLISSFVYSQKEVNLVSPSRNLIFTFKLTDTSPIYKVTFKGKPILDYSAIQFNFLEGGVFGKKLSTTKPKITEGNERYELVVGKTKVVNSHYRQMIIPLEERTGLQRKINLVIRIFDDGIGFRYEFPEQSWKSYTLTDEQTQF